jgi:hypothetical protein
VGRQANPPRLQILSIAELLEGKKIDYPRYAAEEQIPLGGDIEEPF